MHRSLIDMLAWRLVAELARRHPDRLVVIETHPAGGLYDCLALHDTGTGTNLLDANREGNIHIHTLNDPAPLEWAQYATTDEPYQFLRHLEDDLGLHAPAAVPTATRATLTLRAIAAVVATWTMTPTRIDVRNGMEDTSGYGGGARRELFDLFPDVDRLDDAEGSGRVAGDPTYDHWFITRDDKPVAALHTPTATIRWRDGSVHDLHDIYANNGRHLHSATVTCLTPAFR